MSLLPNLYKPHTQEQEKDVLLSQLRDDEVMMLICLYLYFKITSQYVVVFSFQVYLPVDNPSGNITGTVRRKPRAKM